MKLNVELSQFNKLIDENVSERKSQFLVSLNPVDYQRYKQRRSAPDLVTDFDQEISLNGRLLAYDGHGVVVYIKEQSDLSSAVLNPLNNATKYHLTDCDTVRDEKKDQRFGRFVALRYIDGKMPICDDKNNTDEAALAVCGNCLRKLSYIPYVQARNTEQKKQAQREFNLSEFLKKQHDFPDEHLPLRHAEFSSFAYSEDWKAVSEVYKLSQNYCCEECGVQLNGWKTLLHSHHIDGVKSNNHPANLMALCVECHSKQPKHKHLKPKAEVLSYLKAMRNSRVTNKPKAHLNII
ncbi:HNH endonuclease [Vibrio splendidus]|uniref:HNH endonuclease n=1 Tax=Vibrio splendidus TaxID=29497 RepID=UPI00352C44C0